MIAADIAELDSRLKQLTLQIRDKELALFTTNFGVLGTKSAFLCGLGWSGLTMVPAWQRSYEPPHRLALALFYAMDALSICFNLATMALSTWCMVNGPMLAIRGPSGSMGRAVAGMYAERKWALRSFWTGNLSILLASVALGWVKFEVEIAVAITVIIAFFVFLLGYYIKQVTRPRFRLPANTVGKRPQTRNPEEEADRAPRGLIGSGDFDDLERAASPARPRLGAR